MHVWLCSLIVFSGLWNIVAQLSCDMCANVFRPEKAYRSEKEAEVPRGQTQMCRGEGISPRSG